MTNINASIIDQRVLGIQEEIRQHAETDLGFNYRRKRMDKATTSKDITSGAAAEAILAVWRYSPHQAKFMTREHFLLVPKLPLGNGFFEDPASRRTTKQELAR